MKVAGYPADLGGCGHYRLIWPACALAAEGYDVELAMPESDDPQLMAKFVRDPSGHERLVDVIPPDADVVVLQRPLRPHIVEAIPMLQAHGRVVVVEVDDDFARIHPNNVAWRQTHPTHSPDRNWKHLARACELADLVTVSTPALARRYGRHGRTVVIPNHIPASYLDVVPAPHDGVRVGWAGSIDTHPEDLQQTGGAVAQVARMTGATVSIVGTGVGLQHALALDDPPDACGWVPLDDYPHELAALDVGFVPLQPGPFNDAKSWLKGLEMAAVGVPFVASPTVEYRRLADLGVGVTAGRPREWRHQLGALVASADLRAERAAQARDVAAQLTIEANCWRWWEAWTTALALKHRSAA